MFSWLFSDNNPGDQDAPEAVVDPVCGMILDRASARFDAAYAGRDFHFCSAHCQQEFLADQAGFLKAPSKAANGTTAAIEEGRYACPARPRNYLSED